MLVALLAREAVIMWAMRQWIAAYKSQIPMYAHFLVT
jgi:hypothetical protein